MRLSMGKLLVVFFILCGLFFIYCNTTDNALEINDDKINVVVSILPLADFVEKVGVDKVNVIVMIPPQASPATYEPKPSQLKSVSNADMYVKVGSPIPFEQVWMEDIIKMNRNMHVTDCSKGIEIIEKDPHIWLSPRNAKIMVENIYNGLIEIDPPNKNYYLNNKEKYILELESVDKNIELIFSDISNRKIIVFHPAWRYFALDYELEQIPIEIEGKEPSSADISGLIDFAKEKNISIVFAQPQFNAKSAKLIANEIEGNVVFVDSLAKDYTKNLMNVSKSFARKL
ncbi:MAG: zinc ABC transporter substrate-binding protein [Candidatus Aenigmarchaeota archaeon]|nr:zinc ABC transporter substrate-binding protein [Candidatus Aenigmarchaeota archaeon]